jgi:hypothetical protein
MDNDCSDYGCINNNNGCYPNKCNTDAVCSFKAIISPATMVKTLYTNSPQVPVVMRRKNKIVTLQFEGFSGAITGTGTAFLTINQSIYNLPNTLMMFPYRLLYNGVPKISFINVDPNSSDVIQFYLDNSGSGSGITSNDTFTIYGTTLTWITC